MAILFMPEYPVGNSAACQPNRRSAVSGSALREVAEETGVAGLRPHPAWTGLPLDIDSHPIPANPRKQEPAHWHHDYAYLAVADADAPLQAQQVEVHAAAWLPLERLSESPNARLRTVAAKLAALGC